LISGLFRWLVLGYFGFLLICLIALLLLGAIDYLILGDQNSYTLGGDPWTSFGHFPWPVAVSFCLMDVLAKASITTVLLLIVLGLLTFAGNRLSAAQTKH
jgi:hypothetical protein